MPYHAIDAETETSYYSFLHDWSTWQSLVSRDPGLPNRLVCSCCGLAVNARRTMSFHAGAPDFSSAHRHRSLACPADNHSYIHLTRPRRSSFTRSGPWQATFWRSHHDGHRPNRLRR